MTGRFKKIAMFSAVIVLSALILIGIGTTQTKINTIIKDTNLRDTGTIKNAPPLVAFTTIALGSFRGLLADILWLRASSLQDEGNYFEMVQLASTITKLQPRFTGATAYLAWNMAYNISVTCSLWEDRWRWVQRGIELIRDEAIEYNPSDPLLYKELGWIYQHKIGNIMDDANMYYKNKLALMMSKVFGTALPDWKVFAVAPKTVGEFQEKYREDTELSNALKEYGTIEKLIDDFKIKGAMPQRFNELLNNPFKSKEVESFIRSYWLKTVYKLDSSLILTIDNRYGALDWRLPEAHAIYWATKGIEMSPTKSDLNCERMITQSLKDAFMGGRLLMIDDKEYENIITLPNLNVVDSVMQIYQEAYENNDQKSFKDAQINFMKDAMVIMYNFGDYAKAKKYLKALRKEQPNVVEYKLPLDKYVIKEWSDDVKSATVVQANNIINGFIYQSCHFLAYGDIDSALAQEKMAKIVYKIYRKTQGASWKRTGLPDYSVMKHNMTQNCLTRIFPPPLAKHLKAQLEQLKLQSKDKKEN